MGGHSPVCYITTLFSTRDPRVEEISQLPLCTSSRFNFGGRRGELRLDSGGPAEGVKPAGVLSANLPAVRADKINTVE